MKVVAANEASRPQAAKRALALFTALLYLSCLAPAVTYAAPARPAVDQAVQTTTASLISAEKGGEVRLGRASIAIPPGALESDTEISVSRLRNVVDTGGGMTIPVIRKTISSGNDRTVSGGIGISGGCDPSELVSGGGGGSAGMNVGISESDAEVLQTEQDVTGDGIPDIVRPSGGVLEVVKGSLSRDSWDVTFDAERPLSVNAGKVSHNHTKV